MDCFTGSSSAIANTVPRTMASELNDDFDDIVASIESGDIQGFHPLSSDSESEEPPPKRARNKDRDFTEAFRRFQRYYFTANPVYSEADFERRFRMPRRLFERIELTLRGKGEFRADLKDATGKAGINPKMKIISVLRVLAYGMSFDAVDELCEIAESTARKSFFSFIDLMKKEFGSEYLRVPNEADLQRILAINERRGFPG